jgi:hypothetical protein
MCAVLPPPGVNPIAVNKYIKDIVVIVVVVVVVIINIIIEVVSGYARSFDQVPTGR